MEDADLNLAQFTKFLETALAGDPRAQTFVDSESSGPLEKPWRTGHELICFVRELGRLFDHPTARLEEAIPQAQEVYYVCAVVGRSKASGEQVRWSFAGRLRFRKRLISACCIFADNLELYRVLGTGPAAQSESRLQRTHEFSQLFQLAAAHGWAAFCYDSQGKLLDLSPALSEFLGEEPGKLLGAYLHGFIVSREPLSSLREDSEIRILRKGRPVSARVMLNQGGCRSQLRFCALAPLSKVGRALRLVSEERAGLARDIHDGPAQDAAALGFFLQNGSLFKSTLLESTAARMMGEVREFIQGARRSGYRGA